MNRFMQRILLFLLILVPMGCNSSTHISEDTSANSVLFDPTTQTIPLPNVLATAAATDPITHYRDAAGLVGQRPANTPMNPLEALAYENLYEVGGTNAVAGLNAPIYLRFAAPLVPATVNGSTIKVFQITPDSATDPAAFENNRLTFSDVSALFTVRYTPGSTDVQLFPNFPLLPGTRYLYLVTNRVKDAATGGAVASSFYFGALKSTLPLAGPFADLEAIRADKVVGGNVVFSGYAKTMDDLIAARAVTTVGSRSEIALLGRFNTTTAGFIAQDPVSRPVSSLIPVETALRAFAAGQLAGKSWSAAENTAVLNPPGDLQAFWTAAGGSGAPPASIGSVITGTIASADISMDPVLVRANTGSITPASAPSNPAAAVLQPFRNTATKALEGFYYRPREIPFAYLAPAGTAPAGGWPLVIFQHGILRQKSDVAAVAGALTFKGFAVVAIDLPLHGALALPGHDANQQGQDFIALGAPLATRTNIQQAALNLDRLEVTVRATALGAGFAGLGGAAPNPARVSYLGVSLGSIVGAYYLAGNTTLRNPATSPGLPPYDTATLAGDMKGLLSVPGGRLAYLLQESAFFGPAIDQGLLAQGIARGTPAYQQFFLLTQSLVDPVDPATMTTPLPNLVTGTPLPSRLSGRLLVQEATSTRFDAAGKPLNGDLLIPNSATRYFGNALGGREVLGTPAALAVAPGFAQVSYADGRIPSSFMLTLTGGTIVPKRTVAAVSAAAAGPTEGYFQFDQDDVTHGFLIDAAHPVSYQLAQRQMVSYLLTGLVVDPLVNPLGLPRALPGGAGFSWQAVPPAVMQLFAEPAGP